MPLPMRCWLIYVYFLSAIEEGRKGETTHVCAVAGEVGDFDGGCLALVAVPLDPTVEVACATGASQVRTRAHHVDPCGERLTDFPSREYNVVPAFDFVRVAPDIVRRLHLLQVDALEGGVARDEHAPQVVVDARVELGHLLGLLSGLLRRLGLFDAVGLHRVFEEGGFGHCVRLLRAGFGERSAVEVEGRALRLFMSIG